MIVPDLTFAASANVILYTGATPIFVDADPDSWNIDPSKIEAAITPRTRAIIPVISTAIPATWTPCAISRAATI